MSLFKPQFYFLQIYFSISFFFFSLFLFLKTNFLNLVLSFFQIRSVIWAPLSLLCLFHYVQFIHNLITTKAFRDAETSRRPFVKSCIKKLLLKEPLAVVFLMMSKCASPGLSSSTAAAFKQTLLMRPRRAEAYVNHPPQSCSQINRTGQIWLHVTVTCCTTCNHLGWSYE